MNGLVGGFKSGKNSDALELNDYNYESLLTLKYCSKFLKKYILDNNNVDIFIFSWQDDKKKDFINYLNPRKMKLIPQIDFEIPKHLKGKNDKRVNAHYSRWYGFKEVMNLKTEYENENNFKYDLVVNARFDLVFNRLYDFSSLPSQQFHIPIHSNRPTYGWPAERPEILDHIFASSSEIMDKYSSLFNYLDEYTLPDQCPQWNTISNHFLMVWHLWKLNFLNTDIVKKSFSTYTTNKFDGGVGETDYDIIRYRNLSLDNIIKELKN